MFKYIRIPKYHRQQLSVSKYSNDVSDSLTDFDTTHQTNTYLYPRQSLFKQYLRQRAIEKKNLSSSAKKLNINLSEQTIALYLNAPLHTAAPKTYAEQLSEINAYELQKSKVIKLNQPQHKSLEEYIKVLMTSPANKFRQKPESLRSYIDLITKSPSSKRQEALKKYIKTLKETKPGEPCKDSENNNNIVIGEEAIFCFMNQCGDSQTKRVVKHEASST